MKGQRRRRLTQAFGETNLSKAVAARRQGAFRIKELEENDL